MLVLWNIDARGDIIRVNNDLRSLEANIKSFREPLEQAVENVMIPSFKKNFSEEGRPSRWRPLSADYSRKRQLAGFGTGPILDRRRPSGLRVRTTQKARWSIDGRAGVAEFQGLPNEVGYGMFHQTGTSKMPRRPFIMIHDEDVDAIEEIFERWVGMRVRQFHRRGR